ncbi:hypothetical protein J6590_009157 [Homalodisca vitripennis]|nr:hypothetical protein J6590_009157 [Homalodisca vitripennis]
MNRVLENCVKKQCDTSILRSSSGPHRAAVYCGQCGNMPMPSVAQQAPYLTTDDGLIPSFTGRPPARPLDAGGCGEFRQLRHLPQPPPYITSKPQTTFILGRSNS